MDNKVLNFAIGLFIVVNIALATSYFLEWSTPTKEGVITDSLLIAILTSFIWIHLNKKNN